MTIPAASTDANPTLDYGATTATIVDTGHTVQLVSVPGNDIVLKGEKYSLIQAHYHVPSESTLGGKQFAAEFHFVHENASGKTVVLDLFVAPGAENPAWQPFIAAVGLCMEGLAWVVDPTPITMSEAQIEALRVVYDNNIRPVQPLNDRVITVDKP